MYAHKFRITLNTGVCVYSSIRPYTFEDANRCLDLFNKRVIWSLYLPKILDGTIKGWVDTREVYSNYNYDEKYMCICLLNNSNMQMLDIIYNPFMDETKLIRMI